MMVDMPRRALSDLARENRAVAFVVWAVLGAAIAVIPASTITVLAGVVSGSWSNPLFFTLMLIGIAGGTYAGYRQRRAGTDPGTGDTA
ncbi:hypothetical protein D1871_00215 [Nakamurella silvestris]|nr:hypothetical protein D1871_00215 [Nakamurella silvestris]